MLFDFLKKKKKEKEKTAGEKRESIVPVVTRKQQDVPLDPVTPKITIGQAYSPTSNTPLQGDYAKAVCLWAFGSNAPIQQQYSKYFESECGIKNTQEYHKELIRQGYLQEDSPELNLQYLKGTDLKEIAKQYGVKSSGKKAELITRLVEAVPMSELRKYCPVTYSMSPMGEQFLLDHYAYVEIHRHSTWELSWRLYDIEHRPSEPYQETFYRMLVSKAEKDKDFYGRNVYYNLYEMMAEGGFRKRALQMLLQVLYIDLSGAASPLWKMYRQGFYSKYDLRSHFDSIIMIAPGIVDRIHAYADVFSDDDVDQVMSWRLPRNVCSNKAFKNIVHSIIEDNCSTEDIKAIMQTEFDNYLDRIK